MNLQKIQLSSASLEYYTEAKFGDLQTIIGSQSAVILTDENVFAAHQSKFENWKTIVIPAGEVHKQLTTVEQIVKELISFEADRNTLLVGVGGGVLTDIAGFVAAMYMRGIDCGYVPTSLLNLVDASIGGKTGIDFGPYKNLLGSIRQPKFVLQDVTFLNTLPSPEWINGFAEIIKHMCIQDRNGFEILSQNDVSFYQKNEKELAALINKNVALKLEFVKKDEFEKGERKMLNFGHTLGHAVENIYQLSHGHAVAIGMLMACYISEREIDFSEREKVQSFIAQYQLPTCLTFNTEAILDTLSMDKKRTGQDINFVLLEQIGKARIQAISLSKLSDYLNEMETIFSCR